jgi:hypothetical protein
VSEAAFQVGSQVVTAILKLGTLDADLAKHFVHSVLVVELTLFGFADATLGFGIVANSEAHYNISSDFTSVEGAVKNAELNSALGEEAVQVQAMITAAIVMSALVVFGALTIVPSLLASDLIRKALGVESLDCTIAKLLAIGLAMRINLDGLINDVLIGTHKINQVFDVADSMVKSANVNVNAATVSCVGLCTSLSKKADKLLQIVHIVISKNGCHKFALGCRARRNNG